jgi:hypothetical protein
MKSYRKEFRTFGWLIFDWWRKTDTVLLVMFAALFISRRLFFIPVVMFVLTGLEIIAERMIYQVNREWEGTAAGGAWIRKKISTVRWISVPVKIVLLIVSILLLIR